MSDMPGISSEERERRWSNIRHAIRRSGLDALLVLSDGHMERRGSMRYVSNVNTPFMYGYVIFPLEGEPIAVNVRGEWIKDIRILPVRGGWVPEISCFLYH